MTTPSSETAILAGGCFWCLEAVFQQVDGVESAAPGYTGGTESNPNYEQVCDGRTGHAEAVRVIFSPEKISYRQILEIFFSAHNPTTLNRQGADIGTQYRSAIFYLNEQQKAAAEEVVRELNAADAWGKPIVTQIVAAGEFYPAEDYHRDYYLRDPGAGYCQMIIAPKLAKVRKQWADKLKV